jgi:hypothetical protein
MGDQRGSGGGAWGSGAVKGRPVPVDMADVDRVARGTYYHMTSTAAAMSILADGFRDGVGYSSVHRRDYEGVWLAHRPCPIDDVSAGFAVLEVTVTSGGAMSRYRLARPADWPSWRPSTWCVPASVLNRRCAVRQLGYDEYAGPVMASNEAMFWYGVRHSRVRREFLDFYRIARPNPDGTTTGPVAAPPHLFGGVRPIPEVAGVPWCQSAERARWVFGSLHRRGTLFDLASLDACAEHGHRVFHYRIERRRAMNLGQELIARLDGCEPWDSIGCAEYAELRRRGRMWGGRT